MKRALTMLIAVGLLAGCATTPTVFTDYDPAVNFGQYQTYRWTQQPEGFSPLQTQRFVAAVDAKLRERGWTQSPNAQVTVAGHIVTERRVRVDTWNNAPVWGGWGWGSCCWGPGWGPGWGAWGGFNTSTTVRNYTYGTFVIDMFDAQTQRPLWRGIAMGTVPDSPLEQTNRLQQSVDRMFAQFPPSAAAPPLR